MNFYTKPEITRLQFKNLPKNAKNWQPTENENDNEYRNIS